MFLALWEFIIQLGEIGLYTCSHNMKQIIILKRNSLEGYEWLQWVEKSLEIIPVAAAKSLQSCPTLCDPIDGLPPGSPIPGILQARTLEWVAISFSSAWNWKVKMKSPSRAQLLATPWTTTHQAPPSMGFSGQEHWSGVPLPSPNWMLEHPNLKPEKNPLYKFYIQENILQIWRRDLRHSQINKNWENWSLADLPYQKF